MSTADEAYEEMERRFEDEYDALTEMGVVCKDCHVLVMPAYTYQCCNCDGWTCGDCVHFTGTEATCEGCLCSAP